MEKINIETKHCLFGWCTLYLFVFIKKKELLKGLNLNNHSSALKMNSLYHDHAYARRDSSIENQITYSNPRELESPDDLASDQQPEQVVTATETSRLLSFAGLEPRTSMQVGKSHTLHVQATAFQQTESLL